jgi:superkiller protein 3
MLWKSLLIASLLVLNTTSAGWSLELAGRKHPSNVEKTAEIPQSLYDKMSVASENEHYPEAERIARQILRQDPHNRQAIFILGLALEGQYKFTEAESLYRQILQRDPQNGEVFRSLGQVLQTQQKFTEAESLYRQQISQKPLDFQTYRLLGNSLVKQGKLEAALIVFRQAANANPANSYIDLYDIQQNIMMILIQLDREDELIAFIRQRLAISDSKIEIANMGSQLSSVLQKQGKIDESIVVLRGVIAKVPGEINAYLQLGQILIEQGKESEAIEVYQQAIAIPQDGFGLGARNNPIYPILGFLLEKQQRFPEALALYRKIIVNSRLETTQFVSNPGQFQELIAQLQDDGSSHQNIIIQNHFPILGAQISINELLYKQQGWTAVQREMQPINQTTPELAAYILQKFGDQRIVAKQYNDAIVAYQQELKLDEKSIGANTHGNLFLAWTFANQPAAAKAAYQQALKLTPVNKRPEIMKNWALKLDKAGKKTEAIELYQQLLKSPSQEYLFLSLQLANALEQSGQSAAANQEYQKIQVALDKLQRTASQDPNTHMTQGNLYSQLRQPQQAIDSYRKAINLLTKQAKKDGKLLSFSQLKLADNLRITGQHSEAIDSYRQAIQGCECTDLKVYQPSTLHGMAYYGMGLSLKQQGKTLEAKAAFQKALEIDPNYEEAQKSLIHINSSQSKV